MPLEPIGLCVKRCRVRNFVIGVINQFRSRPTVIEVDVPRDTRIARREIPYRPIRIARSKRHLDLSPSRYVRRILGQLIGMRTDGQGAEAATEQKLHYGLRESMKPKHGIAFHQ